MCNLIVVYSAWNINKSVCITNLSPTLITKSTISGKQDGEKSKKNLLRSLMKGNRACRPC